MSDLETKAVDILDKLDALTTQYAPDVIDKAVHAVAITGISNLVYAIAGVFALCMAWYVTKKLTVFFIKRKEKDGYYSAWEVGYILSYSIGLIVCVTLGLSSVFSILDVWNWVAIFNPELAMAHRVLGL